MKKILYSVALAACCMGTMTSCSDFLDASNKSNVTDKQTFATKEGLNNLVNDAYQHLQNVYAAPLFTSCFSAGTDMYADARNKMNEALNTYETLTPENTDIKNLYTYLYSGIRAANSVSYYAQTAQVDDKTKGQLVGEARVLAAYEYYLLVNNFGGVPIMKDFLTTADTGYPKSSAADVYAYIISELEDVISKNVLQASTATKGGGRISQETAKAILAKTYLSAAWDLNKQDYFSKAAALADEVIAGRKLTTPFAKLWKADGSGDDNEEFLWDVEYDLATANNTTSGGTEWSGYYCNYLGGNEDNIKATTSSYVPTLYALHCFKKGDQRYDATFMKELPDINKGNAAGTGYWTWYKNGESLVGKPVTRYYSAWYETDADFEAWKAIDPANRANTYRIPMDSQSKEAQNMDGRDMEYYDNQQLVYGSSPCKKFDDSKTAKTEKNTCYRDIHIITLPEMYLVAAEAYLKAGDNPKALARLNEVHQRAGLSALTGTITIDDILDENACENFGNEARWMDLRRTQTLVTRCTKYNHEMGDKAAQYIGKKLLRPIPQAAIDANDQLTLADQNPGY
ncbi:MULTISPECIES: RagB/SusD family nutrient uptake outer membrane protein [Segatella]|jgi:starch-binding outer membrane protein, SusD/RagB family|uniref:RagB/SusD family nutrient uptake outer membrane protein n=1 Tax=Segatella copri TaxID=165179 RepID=A0AA93BGZ0_9BACT|nr:RagB/SusD family nutrient uptake outer membrane protein [Segatella copri]MBM0265142.1 RagB/SusD family nutrient uptake outer membrane protein [Segatella copri]MCW4136357.1 RagB/SusD family nutrient uptake outer membrane protein [Segatella copri]MCW4144603.1 RagB/SusD family nutrient uptake outer membrane protein [Segatella copri]MCW4169184.1 RagB/SusD family nutrient uptake outer membrane protein [Segatella copri]RGW81146.1 RagB/SusD family nutrient uptake outer membrane protein [Segatella 